MEVSDSKDQEVQLLHLRGSLTLNFNLSFLPLEEALYRLLFPLGKKNNSGSSRICVFVKPSALLKLLQRVRRGGKALATHLLSLRF